MIHAAKTSVKCGPAPTIIGDRVTVGHNAILHAACTVKDDAFVGMGATVMDGAVVEEAVAMVAPASRWSRGHRPCQPPAVGGAPAKFMREMTAEEKAFTVTSARRTPRWARCTRLRTINGSRLEYDKAARRMGRAGSGL